MDAGGSNVKIVILSKVIHHSNITPIKYLKDPIVLNINMI